MKKCLLLVVNFLLINHVNAKTCTLAADNAPKCAQILEKHMQETGGQVTGPISCFNQQYAVFVHFEDGGYSSDNVEFFDVDESTCEFNSVLDSDLRLH